MRAGLELRLSQQLRLSPQLRQALKLLQLSQVELEAELREQLESNPVLEVAEPETDADRDGAAAQDGDHDGGHDDGGEATAVASEPATPEPATADELPELQFAAESVADPEWSGGGARRDPDDDPIERAAAPGDDLQDHLLWQLQLSPASGHDRAIAAALIEALDINGYLRVDNIEIATTLAPDYLVRDDEIEAVRHRLQRFDPAGVASRSLGECLLVQLDLLAPDTPALAQARRLVADYLEQLPRTPRPQLARQLDCEPDLIDQALELIRSLDPKPGARFDTTPPEYIQPDAYVVQRDGQWQVLLHEDRAMQLRINRGYQDMAGTANRETRSYLRGCLQEARWLLKALEQRQITLFRVASAIVEAQREFLEQGPQAMRPLLLKDIAGKLGLHESTISRTVSRKYLHTPRGLFELRHFFSTGYSGGDDGDAAATAVRALVGELIGDEDPGKPLSDQTIANLLKERGLKVARRTVAKYREQLRLPPSHERRRA